MKIKMTRGVIVFAAIIMVTMTIPAVMGQIVDPTGVTADPGGPYSGPAGSPIQFDGNGSMGFISSYEWDFGDGNTGTGVNPNHTYVFNADIDYPYNYTVTLNVTDEFCEFNTATTNATIWVMTGPPPNQPPIADAGGPYEVSEGSDVQLNGTGSSDLDGTITSYEWDFDGDGEYDDATGSSPIVSAISLDGPSVIDIGLRVTDDAWANDTVSTIVTVHNVAPTIDSINAPIDPVQVGTEISLSADFTDPGILDTHTAEWDWGDGSNTTVNLAQGARTVSGSHVYAQAGVYAIILTVTDDDGGSDSAQYWHYIVVYDPDGGFVTGGGWIISPEGAYKPDKPDPTLTGNATFGFVSMYKKGATVPTGETEFQFHAGNLNFHSTSYDWLVIAGAKAQYKGTGTINGAGNYGFMLTAIDEELTPSTDADMFRIKIWDNDNGDTIVYDNQLGDDDDADPVTALGGGSIVIHKK